MGVRLGSMKLYIIGLVVEVGAGLKNELLIVLQPVEQTLLITMVIKIFLVIAAWFSIFAEYLKKGFVYVVWAFKVPI